MRKQICKIIQTMCVFICFLTFDFCANALPHTIHWNGFSPVWLRTCCWRSKFLLNVLSQYWHLCFFFALLVSSITGFVRRALGVGACVVVLWCTSPFSAIKTKTNFNNIFTNENIKSTPVSHCECCCLFQKYFILNKHSNTVIIIIILQDTNQICTIPSVSCLPFIQNQMLHVCRCGCNYLVINFTFVQKTCTQFVIR